MRTLRISAFLAVLVLVTGTSAALARPGETVFFEAPGDVLGVPADHQAKVLAQLATLGVRALRVTLYWRDVAPHPNHRHRPSFDQANPKAYDWGGYDTLIAEALAMHWTVLLTVSGPVP